MLLNKFKRNKKEIIFFRHGETDWNAAELIQGRTDIYLNPKGIMQAEELGFNLMKENIEHIISSPMKRAKTTGKIIADVLKIPHNFETHSALVERDFGVLEGRKISEVLVEYKETFDLMDDVKNPQSLYATFPDAENKHQVLTRVLDCACNFMNSNSQYNKVAVSCHGGILRYINLLVNKKVTGYGNCDYIKIRLKDLEKYNNKLKENA